MKTITLTIPEAWLADLSLSEDDLRYVVELGLRQFKQGARSSQIMPSVHRQRVRQLLENAGLSLPISTPLPSNPSLTDEQRAQLAYRFSVGGPVSNIIAEDREAY